MLTADDGQTDGKYTKYLSVPQRWRFYDPPLFDLLQQKVMIDNNRNVTVAKNFGVIPKAEFYNELLPDSLVDRINYFKQVKQKLGTCDLIFYDPDNGIEIKSRAKGKRNSAKYIYWDEVSQTFNDGQSVLVYQHFPRVEHTKFIERMMKEYKTRLNAARVYYFRTSYVAYFLSVQEKHEGYIHSRLELLFQRWNTQIYK